MELFLVIVFFALIALASAFGLTADSRDGADWVASIDGQRQPRRL